MQEDKSSKSDVLRYQDIKKLDKLYPVDRPTQPEWTKYEESKDPYQHGKEGTITGYREAEYRGCFIQVKTTYEIKVNEKPLGGHFSLGNNGRVYSHACPYRDFGSTVDLVKCMIDLYPDGFPKQGYTKEYPATCHESQYRKEE